MAIENNEDVLSRALADVSVGREKNGLVVTATECLHLGQRGVHVHTCPFGSGRHCVRVMTTPRADLRRDPVCHSFVTEVGTPWPGGDGHLDRARDGVQPHFAVAEVDQWPNVATIIETVHPDERNGGG